MAAVLEFPNRRAFPTKEAFASRTAFPAPTPVPDDDYTPTRCPAPCGGRTSSRTPGTQRSVATRPVDGRPRPSRLLTFVVLAFVAAGLLGVRAIAGAGTQGAESWSVPARSGEYVVVGPGDTLDSLAREYAPESDPGNAVASMEALNGGDRSVAVGDVLAMPALDE